MTTVSSNSVKVEPFLPSDDEPEDLWKLASLWRERFDPVAFYHDGGIVKVTAATPPDSGEVMSAYLARYGRHLKRRDFARVIHVKHKPQLLRQLFMHDSRGCEPLAQVETSSLAKSFAQQVLALMEPDGVMFSNTSPMDPFDDAAECDLSTPGCCHSAKSACALVITPRYLIRVEVIIDHLVEA